MAEEQTPTLWFFMQCLTSHGRRRLLTTSPDTRTRGNKRNKMLIKTEVFKTKHPFFPFFYFLKERIDNLFHCLLWDVRLGFKYGMGLY